MESIIKQTPDHFLFHDDGRIPNNNLPLLIYRDAISHRDIDGAEWLESHFKENDWRNSWRGKVYNYHHYHSLTHEVMGVYRGKAILQFGGEEGSQVEVNKGDVIIIPAGVGHKCISSSDDFAVVGAYPDGKEYDLLRGDEGEQARNKAEENIKNVPLPTKDPLYGREGELVNIWKNVIM